ncbi:hypothetical protein [Aurantivibrio plasticivorans]
MTVNVIELNDAGLRLFHDEKTILESPGLAVVQGQQLLLGEDALSQYRLHPVNTFSHFWHRLSAEALTINHPQFRHHADLAYSQLQQLHQALPEMSDVIFALPGSFTREQMSMLLGIVDQCSFNIVGLIDSALASSVHAIQGSLAVHVDLQLHQAIISTLEDTKEGKLIRSQVDTVPGAGILAIRDAWARGISDYFMEQARFDPLHSASSEQSLYDQLPLWVNNFQNQSECILTIENKSAKISHAQFIQPVSDIYARILDKAFSQRHRIEQLIVGDRLAILPGFLGLAQRDDIFLTNLNQESLSRGILANVNQVQCDPSNIHLVLSLDIDKRMSPQVDKQNSSPNNHTITHCLIDCYALPINTSTLFVDIPNKTISPTQTGSSTFSVTPSPTGIQLSPLDTAITLRGKAIIETTDIYLGDELQIADMNESIRFINVAEHR